MTDVLKSDNVLSNKQLQEKITETINRVREVLKASYGPLGSHTFISNRGDVPIFTKDGYTILSKIFFQDIVSQNIHILLQRMSKKLVNEVGDGSTSAIITASSLHNTLLPLLDKYKYPKQFGDKLKLIEHDLANIINKFLTISFDSIDDPDRKLEVLTRIASLSNNNDKDIGIEVAKIVSNSNEYTSINVETSLAHTEGITAVIKDGYNAKPYKALTPYMFKSGVDKTIELNSCIVIMAYELYDIHYSYIQAIANKLETAGKDTSLVVIYDAIDKSVIDKYMEYIIPSTNPKLFLVNSDSLASDQNMSKFQDLSVYLDCNPQEFSKISNDYVPKPDDVIGSCGMFKLNRADGCSFIKGKGTLNNEKFQAYINSINQEYLETNPSLKIQRGYLKNRIRQLNGSFITIFVGGATMEEMDTKKYLVEDSVLACKSAIINGYTLGSNVAPLYAVEILMDALINNVNIGIPLKTLEAMNTDEEITDMLEFLLKISKAYKLDTHSVLSSKVRNFITTSTVSQDVRNYSLENFLVYDILKDSYDNIFTSNVVASAKTDIEIMRTAFSIITLLMTSNQFIS